ncbi:isochorismate synthase [Nonomuraea sp. NPDC023979]|uniref:isochorismate synthase n=1 Tax=Nonomuraea sp. NPDC023979 TaxID=3154796 RepID=UPI0033C8F74F
MSSTTWPLMPLQAPLSHDMPTPRILNGYTPSTLLFGAPTHTLLAAPDADRPVLTGSLRSLAGQVRTTLTEPSQVAAGAISFDGRRSRLIVSSTPRWRAPLLVPRCFRCRHPAWTVRDDPPPEDYHKSVQQARDMITTGALDKLVLARTLLLAADHPLDVAELLAHLPGAGPHVFAAPLGDQPAHPGGELPHQATSQGAGDQGTLIGASPELLVSRHGRMVTTNPLAGSAPRALDPATDQASAHALQNSRKDRHEHRLVVEAVADALAPLCSQLHVPDRPQVMATTTMWHLSTPITGLVRDPAISSLTLAAELHPTPAVCGTPTRLASSLIPELEPVERGYYAGLVGWQDAAGDGEWALALRSGLVVGDTLRLFAGAGIVADSDPDAELAETSAKFGTLLRALRIPIDL